MIKDYYHFTKQNQHFLMFGLLTAFFGNYGQSFFIAWFGASFQQAFELTSTEYGTIYSTATLASGLLILYFGGLFDRVAVKTFTTATSLGLLIACLSVFFASNVWQLAIGLFLLRFCGQGLMFHIAFTSMAKHFNKNRGKALGFVAFGMPLGEAILPSLAFGLITLVGWRYTWLALAGALVLLYIPLMIWLLNHSSKRLHLIADQHDSDTDPVKRHWTRKEVVGDKNFWLLLPAILSPAFIVTGIFIHQHQLLSNKNWDAKWFAMSFIIYAFAHLKSSLIVGALVDKFNSRQLFSFYLLPLLFSMLILIPDSNYPILTLVFMFLMGLSVGSSGPIVNSLWAEIYGQNNLGAIRSMVTSIMVVSTAIAPVAFGWLFDNGMNFQDVMKIMSVYLVIAMLIVILFVLKPIGLYQNDANKP
ncbi:MAG: MFS transporter [Gammaproteobacteria bacterium]|nr:MFS transporter [Gammaproteobacteria bacterium]MDH5630968.1 MFS transporter [Gammaproteobacteria bacterium]